MHFAIISVYYNASIEESRPEQTLLSVASRAGKACVYVVDNSTDAPCKEKNRIYATQQGYTYIDMHGNAGLTRGYIAAIDAIAREHSGERALAEGSARSHDESHVPQNGSGRAHGGAAEELWIITTDQDTSFPANYLEQLENAAANTEAMLIAPVVRSGELILSPCRKKGIRFCSCDGNWQEGTPEERFFVNTGLCIRGSLFMQQGLRYNEELFLDFTDFDLQLRIRKLTGTAAEILSDVALEQAFSGTEATRTATQDLERCRIYIRDGEAFYRTWYPGDTSYKAYLFGRRMKLALRHRDGRFLKKL